MATIKLLSTSKTHNHQKLKAKSIIFLPSILSNCEPQVFNPTATGNWQESFKLATPKDSAFSSVLLVELCLSPPRVTSQMPEQFQSQRNLNYFFW